MNVIPTLYHDHLFRSRLEARYAVFLDALDEKWIFEKEGYSLDGDNYLPDLWLPRLECWLEIKGVEPNETEIRKCRKLQFFTGHDVVIFHGLPMEYEGTHFGQSKDRGGELVERFAQWEINGGLLAITDYPNEMADILRNAASRAKQAQFEFGASRLLPNSVDYGNLPF